MNKKITFLEGELVKWYVLPERARAGRYLSLAECGSDGEPIAALFEVKKTSYYNKNDVIHREGSDSVINRDPFYTFRIPDKQYDRVRVRLSQLILVAYDRNDGVDYAYRWNPEKYMFEITGLAEWPKEYR